MIAKLTKSLSVELTGENGETFLSPDDAASKYKVSAATIRRLVNNGILRAMRFNMSLRMFVHEADVAARYPQK